MLESAHHRHAGRELGDGVLRGAGGRAAPQRPRAEGPVPARRGAGVRRLAMFYGVRVDGMLPRIGPEPTGSAAWAMTLPNEGLCIDLQALALRQEPEARALEQFVTILQMQRGDYGGKMLTIRREDVRVLAAVLDRSPEELLERLSELGLRRVAG